MAAWRREQPEPVVSLTEDRKSLIHSYMDAEEAEAHREAIEELERQSRIDAESRGAAAEEAARQYATTASEARRDAAEDTVRQSIAAAKQARRQIAEEAAQQAATAAEEARREVEEEVARQVAAAAERAREQARRDVSEEAARQVAAAVEAARREASEEAARQVAAATARARERARQDVSEEAARQVAAAIEAAHREASEEAAREVAAAAGRARQDAAEETAGQEAAIAEEARQQARTETAEETARQVAAAVEAARREASEGGARQVAAADETRHDGTQETAQPAAEAAPGEGYGGREPQVETCRIVRWRGYRKEAFYAHRAGDPPETSLGEQSPAFRWRGPATPEDAPEARSAHLELVSRLKEEGWTEIGQGKEWYETELARAVVVGSEGFDRGPDDGRADPLPEPEEIARQVAATVEEAPQEPREEAVALVVAPAAQTRQDAAEKAARQKAAIAEEAPLQAQRGTAEETAPEVAAATEKGAQGDPSEGLPRHDWVQAANIPVASYIVDTDGVVRWINPAAERLLGNVRGRHFTAVVGPEDGTEAPELFARKVLGTASAMEAAGVLVSAGGARIDVEISAVPLANGHRVVGVFGLFTGHEEEQIAPPAHLTPRQAEVFRLLEQGLSTKQIAQELHLSAGTVKNHVRHLLSALGVHSRLEAVAAVRQGSSLKTYADSPGR